MITHGSEPEIPLVDFVERRIKQSRVKCPFETMEWGDAKESPLETMCPGCGEPLKDGLCERCVCFICKLAKDEYDHEHNEDWQRILGRDCSRWPCRDCQRRQEEMDQRDEPQRARA